MRYYAEFETDKYIREIYFPDFLYKGTMVEVGAGPTVEYSTSKHFRDNGWRCIGIEPNPDFVNEHRREGNEIYEYACSDQDIEEASFCINANCPVSFSSFKFKEEYMNLFNANLSNFNIREIKVKVKKLDTILQNLRLNHIDFLSIDVEGYELNVMKGFNSQKYTPKIILLENYLHNIEYVNYMKEIGYVLDHKMDYNYIFKINGNKN